jgi:hypothetical protein
MPSKADELPLWSKALRPVVDALALAACVACGLAAWQMSAPLTAPTIFPFAETWYAKSVAASTPAEGVADAQKAIVLASKRPENWMLLAYQLSRVDNAMSSRVVGAIRKSYDVSPLAPGVSAYRLGFIFLAWPQMPQDIRSMARSEATQFGATGKGMMFLRENVSTIPDRQSRLEFAAIAMVAQARLRLEELRIYGAH